MGLIDLKGKVAVVTGASQGLGEALAMRLDKEGCKVAVVLISDSESVQESASDCLRTTPQKRKQEATYPPPNERCLFHMRRTPKRRCARHHTDDKSSGCSGMSACDTACEASCRR